MQPPSPVNMWWTSTQKEQKYFTDLQRGKKPTHLLVLGSLLVNIFETKFLLLKAVDFSYAFTELIRVKAFARKTWQRKYIKPTQHGYVCFSFAPKHYLFCDHECKKEFGRANLGRRPPWLPWRKLLSNQNQPATNTSIGKIWPKSISFIYIWQFCSLKSSAAQHKFRLCGHCLTQVGSSRAPKLFHCVLFALWAFTFYIFYIKKKIAIWHFYLLGI